MSADMAVTAVALATCAVMIATTAACTCGHDYGAHMHWRRGTDCALCACPKFHRARRWRTTEPPAAGMRPPPSPPPGPAPGTILRAASGWRTAQRIDTAEGCDCMAISDSAGRETRIVPCDEHMFDLDAWEARLARS